VVFSGADYEAIIREAEKEADVILWDGGNNDMPFYKPDLSIVVTDPHRPGHELAYYPGETNLMMADAVVINKVDTADPKGVDTVRNNIQNVNSDAVIIECASPITVENSDLIAGKKVLVVEDGPTLTHGEMKIGAGMVAAEKFGAAETVDPRPYLVGKLLETFDHYPDIGLLLPAMGYGDEQVKDLESTINNTECDVVIIGTPIDLRRLIDIKQPSVRVTYNLEETGSPTMADVLQPFIK
jgi:predicted GTPase